MKLSDQPTPQQGLSNAEKIQEFHAAIGSPLPKVPLPPSLDTLALRHKLIQEEYEEMTEALEELTAVLRAKQANPSVDITNWVHELTDLLYVTYGAILACGVDANAVFSEVHRANLSKVGGPRRADGKLLKPPGWRPADVRGVIARQLEIPG
ncbi:MAG: hypothetical protein GY805_10920 [Chloroflexi bacterium]|nr:hypothetical protein [Chloroflexota bacterium]